MVFHENLDLKLIKLVRESPVLYDQNNLQYMDFNAREVVWHKIGDELKRSAADCKARWINIRDIYRRILRKTLSDPGRRHRQYKYDRELAFMRPFYRDILVHNPDADWDDEGNEERVCDTDDLAVDSDDAMDKKPLRIVKSSKSSKSPKKKKRKRYEDDDDGPSASTSCTDAVAPPDSDPSDPVEAFLLSIGATLKTFSPYHLNLAKSKIFAVVQEHDLQQIVERQNLSGPEVKVSSPDSLYKEH